MATLKDIREAIAAQLTANVSGLRATPRLSQIQPPAAVIEPERAETHDAALGGQLWHMRITVLVAMNDLEVAQVALDSYLTPGSGASVQDALEVDHTLGGVVDDATVTGWRDYQPYDVGDGTYLGARFEVQVR